MEGGLLALLVVEWLHGLDGEHVCDGGECCGVGLVLFAWRVVGFEEEAIKMIYR